MLYRVHPDYLRDLVASLDSDHIATIPIPPESPPDVRSITLAGAVAAEIEQDTNDPSLTWVRRLGEKDESYLKTVLRQAYEAGIGLADAGHLKVHVQNLAHDVNAGNFLSNPIPCDWLVVCFIWRPVDDDLKEASRAKTHNLQALQTSASIKTDLADLAKRAWLAVAKEQNQDTKNWGLVAQKAGAKIVTTIGGSNEIGPDDFLGPGHFTHVLRANGEPPLILTHDMHAIVQNRAQQSGLSPRALAPIVEGLASVRSPAQPAPIIDLTANQS